MKATAVLKERLVPIPIPVRVLSDAEVNAAFSAISADNELWLAIHQLLAGYMYTASKEVTNVASAREHGVIAHAAGGLEWLGYFQGELIQRFEESHLLDKKL